MLNKEAIKDALHSVSLTKNRLINFRGQYCATGALLRYAGLTDFEIESLEHDGDAFSSGIFRNYRKRLETVYGSDVEQFIEPLVRANDGVGSDVQWRFDESSLDILMRVDTFVDRYMEA